VTARPRIAVLGAGIMGCSVGLHLARRGAAVSLFDAAERPFAAASRWNEGKIHLGYLYGADGTLRTAGQLLPGGLLFRPLVEELIGTSLGPAITAMEDLYLCHSRSVVQAEAMGAYVARVTDLVREHPDAAHYLADASACRSWRLGAAELALVSDSPDIVAGFRVPERSVETNWIADRFIEAVAAEPLITCHMRSRVFAAQPVGEFEGGPWRVDTSAGRFEPFDYVINALWEGRMAIDQTAGVRPARQWSNRYRQSLFLRTRRTIETPCAVIATGPFGDIKNYNGRDFYLSWYPDGLRIESSAIEPPGLASVEMPEPAALSEAILDHLQALLPWVSQIRDDVESCRVGGGWVFAAGRGQLSDPSSSLHQRADFGVTRRGRYFSVDTGKYSTAPWIARSLAAAMF